MPRWPRLFQPLVLKGSPQSYRSAPENSRRRGRRPREREINVARRLKGFKTSGAVISCRRVARRKTRMRVFRPVGRRLNKAL